MTVARVRTFVLLVIAAFLANVPCSGNCGSATSQPPACPHHQPKTPDTPPCCQRQADFTVSEMVSIHPGFAVIQGVLPAVRVTMAAELDRGLTPSPMDTGPPPRSGAPTISVLRI